MDRERILTFHGIVVAVASSDTRLLDAVRHDFSYFETAAGIPDLRIYYRAGKPDYDALPELTASIATPRNISFAGDGYTYIDYFGRGLNIYNSREGTCRVITDDPDLAREIVYLTILSRVSKKLEQKGIHRIHALGIELRGHAILILLPSGGGKSTLALSILRRPETGIRLIAEDSPLIRRDGWLLPFPIRVGVHPHQLPPDIDKSFTLMETRMEFGPKISIDISLFADRLVRDAVPPGLILLGRRTTGKNARIIPVPRRKVLSHTLMNSVIGIGLYQGMEFIFQQGFSDILSHAGIAFSRARNNLNLVRKSRVFEFSLGRDVQRNYETLLEFLAGEYPPQTR